MRDAVTVRRHFLTALMGLLLWLQRRLAQMRIVKNKIHLYSVEHEACRPLYSALSQERGRIPVILQAACALAFLAHPSHLLV
ncbi:hypothetical protein KP17_17190 [Pectobacterium parvum]|nr:hypothetical protein KP17_17190 [Pectobacterium parvum]KHS91362.1 hypothetical protein RC88_16090 [Pectobacterium parvum]